MQNYIVECHINTIDNMRNQMQFLYLRKKFEFIHDFKKSDDALLC